MRKELLFLGEDDIEGGRVGKTVEVWVVAHEERNLRDSLVTKHRGSVCLDALTNARQHLQSLTAIGETNQGDDVPHLLRTVDLLLLLLRGTVGNSELSAKTLVDGFHHLAKDFAMGRGVFNPVYTDIVMYHLMDDGVLPLLFRQVEAGAELQPEVEELRAMKQRATLLCRTLSHEGPGSAQLQGRHGQRTAKHLGIEFLEPLGYEIYGWFHSIYKNYIARRKPRLLTLNVRGVSLGSDGSQFRAL